MTSSSAYEGSVGGVTNGNVKRFGMLSMPISLPSKKETAAKPNITLTKKAPNRSTLVTCQSPNWTGVSL